MRTKQFTLFVTAIVLLAVATITSVGAEDPGRIYKIQPGDTLWGVVNMYDQLPEGVEELMDANGLNSPAVRVGQTLAIPEEWPRIGQLFSEEEIDWFLEEGKGYRGGELLQSLHSGQAYSIKSEAWIEFVGPDEPEPWWLWELELTEEQTETANGRRAFRIDWDWALVPLGASWDASSRTLTTRDVAWVGRGEGSYFLPGYTHTTSPVPPFLTKGQWEHWSRFDRESTYYDSRTRTVFRWQFVPQIGGDGSLVIDLIDVDIHRLEPTEMPERIGQEYEIPDDSGGDWTTEWVSGEIVTATAYHEAWEWWLPADPAFFRVARSWFDGIEVQRENREEVLLTDYPWIDFEPPYDAPIVGRRFRLEPVMEGQFSPYIKLEEVQ